MMEDRERIGRARSAAAMVMLAVACFVLSACRHRAPAAEASSPRIVWPPPPDTPRIEYLQSVSVPADLGIRRNWFVRVVTRVVRGRAVAGMERPYAIAVAPGGAIAVADPDARCVHLFDVARSRYHRIVQADGAALVSPVGVAADSRGRLYVSDSVRRAIYRYDIEGNWLDTLGGDTDLLRPTGLAFDRPRNILYVVDTAGHRLLGFNETGRRVLEAGHRGKGDGEFNYPVSVAVDPQGRLYVCDSMNFRIQVLDAGGRFLHAFGRSGTGPGDFDKAKGIALDSDGHLYVVEGLHDVIHVYDAEGRLLTVLGGSGAGPGEFALPAGIHIDDTRRILVADSANHRIQILRYLGDAGAAPGGS